MNVLNTIIYVLVGLIGGIFSGLIGVGGGIIIIPALVYIFGMSMHNAQGTTLAMMLPPIGFLAVLTYYKSGYINIKIASLMCLGFFVGGLIGAKLAVSIPNAMLKKIFGAILAIIALDMIFSK